MRKLYKITAEDYNEETIIYDANDGKFKDEQDTECYFNSHDEAVDFLSDAEKEAEIEGDITDIVITMSQLKPNELAKALEEEEMFIYSN